MKKLIVSTLALGLLILGLGSAVYAQNNGKEVNSNCCNVKCSNGCCENIDCTKVQN